MMDLDDIRQILELVREHDLAEFELERDGLKIRVRKDLTGGRLPLSAPAETALSGSPLPLDSPAVGSNGGSASAPPIFDAESEAMELAVVKSPLVGTFYRAAEPNASPFVSIGESVKKGQVLCIIEAMKLMNEIESEYDGEVVSVYVENGQPVQYGERLFAIRTM
jgi:acetyl-CoA carboxylase biotin carboxyl carrier protein